MAATPSAASPTTFHPFRVASNFPKAVRTASSSSTIKIRSVTKAIPRIFYSATAKSKSVFMPSAASNPQLPLWSATTRATLAQPAEQSPEPAGDCEICTGVRPYLHIQRTVVLSP
jgi:hypothetical protein